MRAGIESMEVVPYALPFKEPYVTARGQLNRRELLLVRLRCDGLEGLGEAAPLALRGGATLAQIAQDLERCRDLIVGAPRAHDPRDHAVLMAQRGACLQAQLAVELAHWDLRGKQAGVQLCELFEAVPAAVKCNATLTAGPPAQVADRALEWGAQGFDTFKLKVGMKGDVKQVRAVRAALPDTARIRVDANAMWSVDKADRKLERMQPLELAEQPVPSLDDMAALRKRTDVPLAADESVVTVADAERAAFVCDAATVKLAKVGSISVARQIGMQLPVYLSSALDGPVGIAAAAHVARVIPAAGLAHGLATSMLFSDTIAARECTVAGGHLHLTGAPGLGVTLDEAALQRCRTDTL
jgi:o-succinylbenzoate synthase